MKAGVSFNRRRNSECRKFPVRLYHLEFGPIVRQFANFIPKIEQRFKVLLALFRGDVKYRTLRVTPGQRLPESTPNQLDLLLDRHGIALFLLRRHR